MKSIFKTGGIISLILILFVASSAFTSFATASDDDYSCTLTVKYSDGSKAASVKVMTDVTGGISCSGGRSFYTDDDGRVTLKWASGCKLTTVYIKGTGYKVDYQDGKIYTLSIN